jgi:hypothetical protein
VFLHVMMCSNTETSHPIVAETRQTDIDEQSIIPNRGCIEKHQSRIENLWGATEQTLQNCYGIRTFPNLFCILLSCVLRGLTQNKLGSKVSTGFIVSELIPNLNAGPNHSFLLHDVLLQPCFLKTCLSSDVATLILSQV